MKYIIVVDNLKEKPLDEHGPNGLCGSNLQLNARNYVYYPYNS